ncbi:MAG TPA: DUF6379 domain-containing protein [Sphingomonas sp.]|jgi:hypothetical protein|uniref:C-glycoside deglycosidase beta subunit domain-containing protein n=1 Tax=Sphingomonas sp. TaxID=28214 RepID=UPI002ED9406D
MMFDKYLIDADSVRDTRSTTDPDGFSFSAKLGYYRGLGLSMIEELAVSIDGEELPRAAVRFDDGHGPLTLDEMETAYDRRWAFGTPATILVTRPGGFPRGSHDLGLRQKLRVSYLPFPSFNTDRKTIVR